MNPYPTGAYAFFFFTLLDMCLYTGNIENVLLEALTKIHGDAGGAEPLVPE